VNLVDARVTGVLAIKESATGPPGWRAVVVTHAIDLSNFMQYQQTPTTDIKLTIKSTNRIRSLEYLQSSLICRGREH